MPNHDDAFTLLYRPEGHRRWQTRHFWSDDAAMSWFRENLADGDEVYLYENDVWFRIKDQEHTGHIVFWWSTGCHEEMGQDPQGRGFGWSDDHECYVRYEIPQHDPDASSTHVPAPWGPDELDRASWKIRPTSLPDAKPQPDETYDIVSCYLCGRHIRQNEALAERIELLTGRTSGTTSMGSSMGRRTGFSSRGSSHASSSRLSTRRTSGRKFYSVEQVFFCSETCREKQYADTIGEKSLVEQIIWQLRKHLTKT